MIILNFALFNIRFLTQLFASVELPPDCFSKSTDGSGGSGDSAESRRKRMRSRKERKLKKSTVTELTLEVGRKEVEKNDSIKFAVLSEHIHRLGTDLVELKRRGFVLERRCWRNVMVRRRK